MKVGYKYNVKYIKHSVVKGQDVTSFNIGDKIKDGQGYQNYQFTVWNANIPIQDTDKVIIKSIDEITAREYNGKIYLGIYGTVDIEPTQNTGYAPAQPAPTFTQQPETFFAAPADELLPWEL